MAHINKCIKDLIEKSGKKPANEHAAVWVPDAEAAVCMVDKKTQFNLLNRRVSFRDLRGPLRALTLLVFNADKRPEGLKVFNEVNIDFLR